VKLTTEEREILKSYEKGEWTPSKKLSTDRKELQEYAKAALRKDKRVNIRISTNDLVQLQHRAVHEGIPYQTLISSVLHKFLNGRLVERGPETKKETA
jgi:predicted DNA binding CopG/RHH family protein